MCKHQNITGLLLFMIVFEIRYNYLNVLSFGNLSIYLFFSFLRDKMCASEILRAQLGSGTQFVQAWFRTLSNTFDVTLWKNISQLLAFNYFRKKFH